MARCPSWRHVSERPLPRLVREARCSYKRSVGWEGLLKRALQASLVVAVSSSMRVDAGTIRGSVYYDDDGDGLFDADEQPAAGAVIY